MKQDIEVASRIEREKVIQELHVAYKMHKDPKHYIISSAAIQKYAVPLFKAGAEWQAKQMAWINVKERLPNNDENIFYTNHLSGALGVGFYVDEKWYQAYTGDDIYGITHWMPIPKFNV